MSDKKGMAPEQMQQRSQEKVKQIQDLMTLLEVKVEARERINQSGFIEKVVFWIDEEKYTPAEPVPTQPAAPEATAEEEAAPASEAPAEEAPVEDAG